MTWRAIVHRDGLDPLEDGTHDGITPQGSLVVETRLAADDGPQSIIAMMLSEPTGATLAIKSLPSGGIVLVIANRDKVHHATVKLDAEARTDILRITYSWDVAKGAGRLAIEWPERQVTRWVETDACIPVAARDMRRIGGFFDLAEAHPDLIYAALSDRIEPIGPMPTLAAGTPLQTQFGIKRAGSLQRGDHLAAPEGGRSQIVLARIERIVPAFGSFAPVRLRAPYFGLQHDIVVAPDQRLLIGGSEVEYTFGAERVLVPARHLINGVAATWEDCGPLAHYVQCLTPDHAPIIAGGTVVESLYIGRLRRSKPALSVSLLGDVDPMFLPEQAKAPYRVLSPFEAITLAERRAA